MRKYNEKIKNNERQKTAVVPGRKKGEFSFILLHGLLGQILIVLSKNGNLFCNIIFAKISWKKKRI